MAIKFANNSESTIDGNITAGQTTFACAAGQGSRFPVADFAGADTYFYVTFVDISGNREIVKVTIHTANSVNFTCVRAADPIANAGSAVAYSYSTGDRIQMRSNALALSDVVDNLVVSPGTESTYFQIDNTNSGPMLKNNSGVMEVRSNGDADYANLRVEALVIEEGLVMGAALTGATAITTSGVLTGASLVVSGTVTGVTNLTANGAITGGTLVLSGAASGITTLAMSGAMTGGTDITISGTLQAEHVYSTDDIVADGELTVGGQSNLAAATCTGKLLARDHATATVAEVGNIVYGTGSPPTASTTPIGTLFIKYTA